ENKAPLFYPNLYLTIQLRNRECSVLTMEATALTLSLFYRFLRENDISIDERILHNRFISNSEIERLFIFLTKKRSRRIRSQSISKLTLYHRLNTIAGYLSWLTDTLYRYDTPEINILNSEKMVRSIKERKPIIPKRQDRTYENDGIAENVIKIIMDVIDPHSNSNPFKIYVRQRNEILVLMLYELGVRCGELLNIKIEDIDFQKNRIRIQRRADEVNDLR
ncbi:site-specific integrase, partial [Escherichia coli]|nr:site-specific integrase [Escherichia coli]